MTTGSLAQFPAPPDLELPKPERLLALLSRVAPVSKPWSVFAHALMTQGQLVADWRELVILRVGWRQGCDYVLSGHLPIARHTALSQTRVASALGSCSVESSDSPLLAAVDELLSQGRIGVATRGRLKELLREEELIELVMLVGQYVLVSMVCETFALRPETSVTGESH